MTQNPSVRLVTYAAGDARYDTPSARNAAIATAVTGLDDVLEFANLAAFPGTGTTNTIYVAKDTGFLYGWSGSSYVQVGGGGATLPISPAAVSKALRIQAPFDDGVLRDFSSTVANAKNAATPLTTPTYDGSGQIAEIDVLYFPEGWNGYRYWMMNGPYPNANSAYENPCLLVSQDGKTWVVPAGLTNPIAGTASGQGHTDPSLFVDNDGTMYAYWCGGNIAGDAQLFYSKSTDGITWTTYAQLCDFGGPFSFDSPNIVWDGTKYWLFAHWAPPSQGVGVYYSTASTVQGLTKPLTPTTVTGKSHHNIRYWNDRFYMVISDKFYLYYATSIDGINWALQTTPVMGPGAAGNFDSQGLYRCAFILVESAIGPALDLWYVGYTAASVFHVGYTRMTLGGSASSSTFTTLTGDGTQGVSAVPLAVNAATGQTASLQEWRNSSAAPLLRVTASGQIGAGTGAPAVQFVDSAGNNLIRSTSANSWADTKATSYLQIGPPAANVMLTATSGGLMARFGIPATSTVIGNLASGSLPAPVAGALLTLVASSGPVLSVSAAGQMQTVAANEATGAGSAALGANCPAVTTTAPYTWEKITTSDGSQGYCPVWK